MSCKHPVSIHYQTDSGYRNDVDFRHGRGIFCSSENEDKYLIPIWSSREFAEDFGSKYLKDYICVPITLDAFEENIIDFICENGYNINVFPTRAEILGQVVDITTFAEDLAKALEDYK